MLNNKLKITGGLLKSRSISFNNVKQLKPTKSYIRESIFNIISIDKHMICLDLFCGSGILAAESISRGLKKAVLVESNLKTCKNIVDEFANLKINNYEIIPVSVFSFIKNQKNKSYDIIFIDAPFHTNDLSKTLKMLDEYGFLIENQFIYIEQNKKDYSQELVSIISRTHNIVKDLSMGDVSYTIAKKRDK